MTDVAPHDASATVIKSSAWRRVRTWVHRDDDPSGRKVITWQAQEQVAPSSPSRPPVMLNGAAHAPPIPQFSPARVIMSS